ncbi:ORC-CDC6 family AAA ATPase [Acinetobacter oleivorans]|uniref:ORC-CDC6 family AAA ATPase n=1 Tax=Acinetobacter oleivorans TaxID=1148157 RepID=UPI003F7CC9B3
MEIEKVLSNIRSEHIGMDVWNEFVVPFNIQMSDFHNLLPIKLEGSRGSGKTMILRYLSHYSQFSLNRKNIPHSSLKNIGIYFKADTQFFRMLQKRGIDEIEWINIFNHYLNLVILTEIISALLNIGHSDITEDIKNIIKDLEIESLYIYNKELNGTVTQLFKSLKNLKRESERAVTNPRLLQDLMVLPNSSIIDLIAEINEKLNISSQYHVHIDEYENLLPYQQKIINSRMKHSEPPICYNIAIKVNGAQIVDVDGSHEKIDLQHDFTTINLDKQMLDNFDIFSTELLISRVSKVHKELSNIFENIDLHSESHINLRLDPDYQNKILDIGREILPNSSHEDLANEIFEISIYKSRLKKEIEMALKSHNTKLKADDFIDNNFKKYSVVCSSLLYRKTSPETIFAQFCALKNGLPNDFEGSKEWMKNNFIGSYIKLAKIQKNRSTFYAGLDSFTKIANGNIRYFLELCRSTFANASYNSFKNELNLSIDKHIQHNAAIETSELFFKELSGIKPDGNFFKNLCARLGQLFSLFHDRQSQSEPEITHFNISDPINIDDNLKKHLDEAVKWGVLYQTKSTKEKNNDNFLSNDDYVLSPIFAPHFFISYRKIRKVSLNVEQVNKLLNGTKEEFDGFLEEFRVRFMSDNAPVLFQEDLFK